MLGLFRPDLLANLLLLTYSGSVQLAPAIALGLVSPVPVGKGPVLGGLAFGEVIVISLTFFGSTSMALSTWTDGLAANIIVLGLGTLVVRRTRARGVRVAA